MAHISEISTEQLIADHEKIISLQQEYFPLCEKYSNSIHAFKSDESLHTIKIELANRVIEKRNVKTDENKTDGYAITIAPIIQRLQETISKYKPEPHECKDCCGCELTEQGKSELKILEFILHGEKQEAIT